MAATTSARLGGWSKIELTAPVFVGDTIYADSEVLSKRASKGRPGQGVVTVRTRGLKADGTVFMVFERSVLVPMQGPSAPDTSASSQAVSTALDVNVSTRQRN